MTPPPAPGKPITTWRRLLALDFDDTVVNENTDIVARNLLDPSLLKPELEQLYNATGWTAYMQAIFQLLADNHFDRDQIRSAIRGIPEVPGMVQLIHELADQHSFDVIVISDANSEFINTWCSTQPGLPERFSAILTNPATFDEENHLLTVHPYHHQTECQLSTANLCKGRVLEEFLVRRANEDGIGYGRVFYVGDGRNDVCPSLRLSRCDAACSRMGMAMDKNLQTRLENADPDLVAKVIRWTDGTDLLAQILERITNDDPQLVPDNAESAPPPAITQSRKENTFWK